MLTRKTRIRLFLRRCGPAAAAVLCALLVGTTLLLTQKKPEPAPAALPTARPVARWTVPTPSPKASPTPAFTAAPVEDWDWPVEGEVVTPFSVEQLIYDATLDHWAVHPGLDIRAAAGSPVAAAHDGRVTQVTRDKLTGLSVTLLHENGLTSRYRGLDTLSVTLGDVVAAGDPLGTLGESNLAEAALGPHLHFEMEKDGTPCDPGKYLPKRP